MDIRLLRHRWELHGTLYCEFQPGTYAGEHWHPGAVYIYHEFWPDLGDIVARHVSGYSEYSRLAIGAKAWEGILADFAELATALRAAGDRPGAAALLPVLFRWFEPLDGGDWRQYVLQYAALVGELSMWVRAQLAIGGIVSLLGI